MTYHHLMEKLIKQQEKFMPKIDQLRSEGTLPEELDRAAIEAADWAKAANEKLGPGDIPQDIPDTDPLANFSNMLFQYQDVFDEHERNHVTLYREYAEELFGLAHPLQD